MKAKVSAKNGLESFAYQVRNACDDPKMKDLISEDDKTKVIAKVDEIVKWVDDNPSAETEEFEAKQKELEEIWKPIMMAAYSQGEGAPDGAGAPGADGAPGDDDG